MIGEETDRKVTPAEAANRMRSLRNDAGNRLFKKSEWLTVQQVTSYFSRLAVMERMSQLPTAVESLEEDVEAVVQQSERYHLRQKFYNTLTLQIIGCQCERERNEVSFFHVFDLTARKISSTENLSDLKAGKE